MARPFDLSKPALGAWRDGNTGVEGVWRFESGRPGREVMVSALVHGNELCGAWALREALESGIRPQRGALTLAFCNLAAFDRFDPEDTDRSRFVDQDLNRLWGTMPWRASGRPLNIEQGRVLELAPFVERADWLLDLHSMHAEGPPLGLTGLLPHHAEAARALAGPLILVADAGHAAGVRMRDHGRFGSAQAGDAVSLLVECGWHGALSSRDVAVEMLQRFLLASACIEEADLPPAWRQGITGPAPANLHPLAEPHRTVPKAHGLEQGAVLRVTHAVTVQPGEPPRFNRAWQTGETIPSAGTVIGHDGAELVRTPYDNCVLVMPSLSHATPGATMVRLAHRS